MTHSSLAATRRSGTSLTDTAGTEYRPGACNIGPAEVARRRLAGHVALGATVVVFVALVVIGAPPLVRLIVGLPAAAAASGYLQAWLQFCAGFGSVGVFNFGTLGQTQQVVDAEARRRDRRKANQIGAASILVGVVVAVAAVLIAL
jgi:hypothetical protein